MDQFEINTELNLPKNDVIITKTTRGRKTNIFISDLFTNQDNYKEHLKILKKKLGCNGSIKNETIQGEDKLVMHLQGDQIKSVKEYINTIDSNRNIIVKL